LHVSSPDSYRINNKDIRLSVPIKALPQLSVAGFYLTGWVPALVNKEANSIGLRAFT